MTHPTWEMLHPAMSYDNLGYLPQFLSIEDERSAKEQLHDNYAHGGGWFPFKGFKMIEGNALKYPGDPAYHPLAKTTLRDETIFFYPHAWVAIVQKDGSYEVARMD